MNKTILVILLVLVVGGGAYVLGKNSNKVAVAPTPSSIVVPMPQTTQPIQQTSPTQQASINSYKVIKPNLYIYGSGLSTVKVYGVPTGTGVTDANELGGAKLQSTTNGTQTWMFQPQEEQMLLTSMYIQGFDAKGTLVGTINLPYSGASEVYGAFY